MELEKAIISENVKKYHQTEATCPLFNPAIYNNIGSIGTGPASTAILEGHLDPHTSTGTATTKDFLAYMKKTASIPDLDIEDGLMSLQEFRHSWKQVKERTSSIGPHIGHYKAATQNPMLARLFHLKSEIPLLGGFTPKCYQRGLDVMIMKKANSPDIDKLQTVVLFDSEANHTNKWIGRFPMQRAIDMNAIAPEQYSQPGHSAIDHALNCRLTFDHNAFQRSSFALTCSNLKSCYDRVVHTAVSLALQKLGLPIEFIIGMLDSIQHMVHNI